MWDISLILDISLISKFLKISNYFEIHDYSYDTPFPLYSIVDISVEVYTRFKGILGEF